MDYVWQAIAEKADTNDAGDLVIEGWAARYNEPDRQQEFFMDGAFSRAADAVKAGKVPLLYHHKQAQQLGQVVALEEKADGVWMKAVVPKPVEDWAKDAYDKIRRGMMNGLSAKGMFTKQPLPSGGARIKDVDLWEISATPMPVGPGATIQAVAQKALDEFDNEAFMETAERYFKEQFGAVQTIFDEIEAALEGGN